jgi:DNA gyrase/topoisomerase IV subunit B
MESSSIETPDIAGNVVRALVLYSLAEFQSGHARSIIVSAEARSFSVSDDGRGHAIDRSVGGSPYLDFAYEHLDYPFEVGQCAPVQLQGIGLSLINVLCADLSITVRKPQSTLRRSYRNGVLLNEEVMAVASVRTGNTIAGTIGPALQRGAVNAGELQEWLAALLRSNPGLSLVLNGRTLAAAQ